MATRITLPNKKHEYTAPAPKEKATHSGPPKTRCIICNEEVLKSQTYEIEGGRACRRHSGVVENALILRTAKKHGFKHVPDKCWTCGGNYSTTLLTAPKDDDFRFRKVLRSFQPVVNETGLVYCCEGCIRNLKLEV